MAHQQRDEFERLNERHAELLDRVRGQDPADQRLRAAREAHVPYRPPLRGTPLILDTDIGGDPDDAIAMVVAAQRPELSLVITSDECAGGRARFARLLLDLLGRQDVPVLSGAQLEGGSQFCVADLLPSGQPVTPATGQELAAAVAAIADAAPHPGAVRWVGMGPLSNLAAVLAERSDLAGRLRVTQMGGALDYRDPQRGEHNFRRDPAAVGVVLAAVPRPWLVTSDVTFTPELGVSPASPIYQRLAAGAPAWARLLRAHLDRWFEAHHPSSYQHDGLALAVALGLPFVEVDLDRVVVDGRGRMRLEPGGREVFYTRAADYPAVRTWLGRELDAAAGRADSAQPRPT